MIYRLSIWTLMGTATVSCKPNSFSQQVYSYPAKEDSQISSSIARNFDTSSRQIDPRLLEQGIYDRDSLKKKCDASKDLNTKQSKIEFPPYQECKWGAQGNLEKRQGYLQAIHSQVNNIELSKGSVLCDLEITTQSRELLHYDDFLFLTMADALILSSNGSATNFLEKEDDVLQWNVKNIMGKPIHQMESAPYCLIGSHRCQITGHDQSGTIDLALSSRALAPISFKIFDKNTIPLGVHVTGDNDAGDCFHSGINFEIKMTFLPIDNF